MRAKATNSQYALATAHADGSVYATSSANSAVTADADGSAWMSGSGGGLVDSLANGDSRVIADGGSGVIATAYGDVIIRIGGGGEEAMMSQARMESESLAMTSGDISAQIADKQARIAAVKAEAEETD